jgi:hypothetical protein
VACADRRSHLRRRHTRPPRPQRPQDRPRRREPAAHPSIYSKGLSKRRCGHATSLGQRKSVVHMPTATAAKRNDSSRDSRLTTRLGRCHKTDEPEHLDPGRDQIGKVGEIVSESLDDFKSVPPATSSESAPQQDRSKLRRLAPTPPHRRPVGVPLMERTLSAPSSHRRFRQPARAAAYGESREAFQVLEAVINGHVHPFSIVFNRALFA